MAILTLISFDRARALSNPLRYRTEVTNKGMFVSSMDKGETPKIYVADLIITGVREGKDPLPLFKLIVSLAIY